jgi:hypothetical protein
MASQSDPVVGTDRSVVETVVAMVTRGSYRQARLQLNYHERRNGLVGVAERVARLTAPPADVDPRTEAIARQNVPAHLPVWLADRTVDEVVRICARQSMHDQGADAILARLLAAAIVDDSVPAPEAYRLPHRPHVDLRDQASDAIPVGSVVDVSGELGMAEPGQERRPDRSLTDWLSRKA